MTENVRQDVVARTDEISGVIGLSRNLNDFDQREIIAENNRNIREYLVSEGFCMVDAGSESSYWAMDDRCFYVRLSCKPLTAGTQIGDRTVIAYSEKKDGYAEIINTLQEACINWQ